MWIRLHMCEDYSSSKLSQSSFSSLWASTSLAIFIHSQSSSGNKILSFHVVNHSVILSQEGQSKHEHLDAQVLLSAPHIHSPRHLSQPQNFPLFALWNRILATKTRVQTSDWLFVHSKSEKKTWKLVSRILGVKSVWFVHGLSSLRCFQKRTCVQYMCVFDFTQEAPLLCLSFAAFWAVDMQLVVCCFEHMGGLALVFGFDFRKKVGRLVTGRLWFICILMDEATHGLHISMILGDRGRRHKSMP